MKRHLFAKRPNFEKRLEEIGFNYWNLPSGPQGLPYYQEGVCYALSERQVDLIQEATQELHDMSLNMVSTMILTGDYPSYFGLSELDKELIEQSWNRGDKSLYGRFDLVYNDKDSSIKMLEYNGDTPVSILECSVAQWDYIQEADGIPDDLRTQYNMIDETLIETWQNNFSKGSLLHFASGGGFRHEDFGNLVYIMDTAFRAGMKVKDIQMQQIGFDCSKNKFVDLEEIEMKNVFKLYPWEWMTEESFSQHLKSTKTQWMEPAWKMLLSNKAMLVKLWELYPNHPLLLESYSEKDVNLLNGTYAKKAIHGREGSNIYKSNWVYGLNESEQLGQGSHYVPEYVKWGYMYQKWHEIPKHDGYRPIIGSWVIGDKACGMSIREDKNEVTGNDAFFASHIFVPYYFEERYAHLYKD